MKYTVQLTEGDLLDAMKLHSFLRPTYRWMLYVLGVIYVFAACFALYKIIALGEWDPDIIPILVVVAILVFLFRRSFRRQVTNSFRQQKSLREAFTIEFTEEGYFMDSPTGTTRMRWSDIHGWRSDEKYLLLYHSELLFNLLPLRVVDEPQTKEKLLMLIRSKAGDPKR